MTSLASVSLSGSADLDERILAQSALDAAEDALQSLCAAQAGTFVQVERRGKALQEGLQELLTHLEKVQDWTVQAQQLLQQEEDSEDHIDVVDHNDETGVSSTGRRRRPTLAALAEQHRVRRRTLLQHSSLLELLELPSLMDACVRSNLYDEALSIAGLANTLERRSLDSSNASTTDHHSAAATAAKSNKNNNNSNQKNTAWLVVRQVVDQIRQRQEDLRQQLWQRLSQASVTLPDCLEVVTALRRLNAIDLERSSSTTMVSTHALPSTSQNLEAIHAGMEVQLQIDFLEARDVWLETTTTTRSTTGGGTTNNNSTSTTEDLLDTIERYRTRVFEIATQFNAIFRANATMVTTTTTTSQHNNTATTLSSLALLRLWMSRRVETFLQVLASQLRTHVTETSHLRDVLEATLFFATSLGRLGADFTARLPVLFEPVLVQIVTAPWKDGVKQLNETLVACREAGVATPLSTGAGGTTTTSSIESLTTETVTDPEEAGQPLRPPRMLLNYPPLARFVNAILMGYNELRRCLLPGALGPLRHALSAILVTVRQDLVAHERAVHVPGLKGQATQLRQVAVDYKEILITVIEPYVWGSLYAAVGNISKATEYYETLQTNLKPPPPVEEEEIDEDDEDDEQVTTENLNQQDAGNGEDLMGETTMDNDEQTLEKDVPQGEDPNSTSPPQE